MSRAAVIAVVAVAFASAWVRTADGTRARVRTVPCSQSIDHPRFPYRSDGYRLVLNTFSVPPGHLRQVVHVGGSWPYWRKTGLVVRANAPAVTVTVPRAWQSRAAIIWGNAGKPASSLRFASCAGRASKGRAYAGGFYLRARSGCVPLVFRVGARAATVRFGVGRRCRSALPRAALRQCRPGGRQCSTGASAKRAPIMGLVVTGRWMCGVDAAAPRRIWSLEAWILWARTTRYDEPDQDEG